MIFLLQNRESLYDTQRIPFFFDGKTIIPSQEVDHPYRQNPCDVVIY